MTEHELPEQTPSSENESTYHDREAINEALRAASARIDTFLATQPDTHSSEVPIGLVADQLPLYAPGTTIKRETTQRDDLTPNNVKVVRLTHDDTKSYSVYYTEALEVEPPSDPRRGADHLGHTYESMKWELRPDGTVTFRERYNSAMITILNNRLEELEQSEVPEPGSDQDYSEEEPFPSSTLSQTLRALGSRVLRIFKK